MESEEDTKSFVIASSGVSRDQKHGQRSDIRFWEYKKGRLEESNEYDDIRNAMRGQIRCLIQVNNLLVSTGSSRVINLWDFESSGDKRKFKTLQGHNGCCSILTHVNSGKTLISGSEDTTIKVWKIDSGKLQSSLEGGHKLWVGALEPVNNDLILSGDDDGKIVLWDIEKTKMIKKIAGSDLPHQYNGMINSIKMINNNKDNLFLTASYDQLLKLWDLRTMKSVQKLEMKHGIRRMIILNNNHIVCSDAGGWDTYLSHSTFQNGMLRIETQIRLDSSAECLEYVTFGGEEDEEEKAVVLYGCDNGTIGMTDPISSSTKSRFRVMQEFKKCHEKDIYGLALIRKNKDVDTDLLERIRYLVGRRFDGGCMDDLSKFDQDSFVIRFLCLRGQIRQEHQQHNFIDLKLTKVLMML